jgi:hypothetical protein
MIPNTIDGWLEGLPWGETKEDFFEVARRYRETGIKPEPFTLHNGERNGLPSNRSAHEVAHIIVCKDEDMFDPWYGMDNFVFGNGELLSIENLRVEIEVSVVEEIILAETADPHMREYRRNCITVYSMVELCTDIGDIPYPENIRKEERKRFERQFVSRFLDAAIQKWNAQKAWAELEWKRAIVRSALA